MSRRYKIYTNLALVSLLTASLLILVMGTKILTAREDSKSVNNSANSILPESSIKAAWDWSSLQKFDQSQVNSLLQNASEAGINTVYIDISPYIDYLEDPNKLSSQQNIKQLENHLADYVGTAGKYNISIEALAGSPDWGLSSHAYIQQRFIDFLQNYNSIRSNDIQIHGINFDIEPHSLKDFSSNKAEILGQFVKSVSATVGYLNSKQSNLRLSYAIPYWYDNENGNIPTISYSGKNAPTAYHILDIMNTRPQSCLIIMAYRNKTSGTNGTIAHAQNEILYATKYAPTVKLVVGQETTNNQEANTTFYGKSIYELTQSLKSINISLKKYPPYTGYAIHDLQGLLHLKHN